VEGLSVSGKAPKHAGSIFSSSLLRASYRYMRRRLWQTALMLFGVALGVAVVVAIDLANGSARRAFELSTQAVTGRATHQVQGGPTGVAEDLYARMRVDWGLRQSAPVVEGMGVAVGLDQQPMRILGVDPFAERPFRDYFQGARLDLPSFERFFTHSRATILSERTATAYGLKPGDRFQLQVNDRSVELEVIGTLHVQDPGEAAAVQDLLLMDVAAAQELLGMVGELSRIDLILEPGQAAEVKARLPPGLTLRPASEQADTV
jgi:putative ABC transport system permease protein